MKPMVLISKDILMPGYLPTYGNRYWKTPNIDKIAKQGTVFLNHYTAAPSTGMSFTSMFTGKYPYQLDRTVYQHEKEYIGITLFDKLKEAGISSHIIWSENYLKVALPYSNCFRNAQIHTLDINQPVGPYIPNIASLKRDDTRAYEILNKIYAVCETIVQEDTFIWIHLPHVILGRTSYGDDIDLLDSLVGKLREIISDDCFFITADHGNMNGVKGKWVYGFEVYQPAIRIPLITPMINGQSNINYNTSNIQLSRLIVERDIEKIDYVVSDSAYYCQPNRSLSIIAGEYKLIYSKLHNTFELYDVEYDPNENVNLLKFKTYDKERHRYTNVKEVYYYPRWDKIEYEYNKLLSIYNTIYRDGPKLIEAKSKLKYYGTQILGKYLSYRNIKKKKVRK